MLKAILAAPFMWLAWMLVAIVAQLIGFPLIAVLALFQPWLTLSLEYSDKRVIAAFSPYKLNFFYLWENDEDGIDGIPLINNTAFKNQFWIDESKLWSRWRRIFVWSAWRNSVNNQRFFWFFRLVINPSQTHIRYFFKNSAYFVWQGLYSALYLTLGSRYLFVGYKFHQPDAQADLLVSPSTVRAIQKTELAADDTRKPGAGFTLDLFKKVDPNSWTTPAVK